MRLEDFHDLRPYTDAEIPEAMERIASSEYLPLLGSYLYPQLSLEQLKELIRSFKTTHDFQMEIMHTACRYVVDHTLNYFQCNGFKGLATEQSYLYVSNHRDIVLDAMLLQLALTDEGFVTTEITFGANLMNPQLVVDIGLSNKMFKVERPNNYSPKEFYLHSRHLSDYLRFCINDKKQSLWIAQRNGRTKDGNDKTDPGIIRMFAMSGEGSFMDKIQSLNLCPIAVSYEWEPCALLKTKELLARQQGPYEKHPGEDLNSILTGIKSFKGGLEINICTPINTDGLQLLSGLAEKEQISKLAALIDKRIYSAYKLWPNNYVAADLLNDSNTYSTHYTPEQKQVFINKMNEDIANLHPQDAARNIYLHIYANPVYNKHKIL